MICSMTAPTWGKTVRLSGAVDGESIEYDSENAIIRFEIVNIPSKFDDLASALHAALANPGSIPLVDRGRGRGHSGSVATRGAAILTGALERDGIFHASELLLKCPRSL